MRTIKIIAEVTGCTREVSSSESVYYRLTFDTLGYSMDDKLSSDKLFIMYKGITRPLSVLRISSNDGDKRNYGYKRKYGVYESYCKGIMEYGNVVKLVVEEHIIGVTEYLDKNKLVCKHGTKLITDDKAYLGDIQYELKEAYQVGNSEIYRLHKNLALDVPVSVYVSGINRAITKTSSNLFGE